MLVVSQKRAKAIRRAKREAERLEAEALERAEAERRVFESTSFMQKLLRADAHIEELNAAIEAWYVDGHRSFVETDDEGMRTLYAQVLRPLPEGLPLLIGDASQAMLSALDHLAFAVASRHPDGLTDDQEEASAFPIRSSVPRNNRGHVGPDRRIEAWPPCARAKVQLMQPHLGTEGLDAHPLWQLRDLANRDKHRQITVAVTAIDDADVAIYSGVIDYLQVFHPQEVSTEPVPLMTVGRRSQVNMKSRFTIVAAFGAGPLLASKPIVTSLASIRRYIEEVPVTKLRAYT